MRPSRRATLLLALAAGAAACAGERARPGVPPRHAVLVTVADLRADHVTAWLYPRDTTSARAPEGEPSVAIDDLVKSGVLFARAFAPSAMERPSLAALHTGRSPLELGVADEDDALPAEVPTLAEELAAAGLETGAFVASRAAEGLGRGFATFSCTAADPDPDHAAVRGALDWARATLERDPEAELFVWIHLAGPTPPYAPPPLGDARFDLRFTDPTYAGSADGSLAWLEAVQGGAVAPSGQDVEQVVALYDGEIARVNALVRAFTLAWAGVYDLLPADLLSDTAFVLAGVSGAELLQHGGAFDADASLFGASLHVPLALRHPRSLTGSRALAEPVELADVAPTLAEWLGARAERLGGRSLLALTDSYVRRAFAPRPALSAWRTAAFSARDGRWRLVWCPACPGPDAPPFALPARALYDVEADPLETVDVAAEHPEVADALERAVRERLEALGVGPAGAGGAPPE